MVPVRRILIVEDNRDAASSLKEALELQGHLVDLAHTGPDGLEKARAFAPEIVLCDIGLPGMDGYSVARALRADERLRPIMLVAVSGYAAEHDKSRATRAGFNRHLAKPVTMEALTAILAEPLSEFLQGESAVEESH
jgi:CheY-like chemotaxis protein